MLAKALVFTGIGLTLAHAAGLHTLHGLLLYSVFSLTATAFLFALEMANTPGRERAVSLERVQPFNDRVTIYEKGSGFAAAWYLRRRLKEEIARSRR